MLEAKHAFKCFPPNIMYKFDITIVIMAFFASTTYDTAIYGASQTLSALQNFISMISLAVSAPCSYMYFFGTQSLPKLSGLLHLVWPQHYIVLSLYLYKHLLPWNPLQVSRCILD